MKLIAGYVGKAKDFKPIFRQEKDLLVATEKVKINNFDIYILPEREAESKCK